MLSARRITPKFEELGKVEALAMEAFPPEEYLAPQALVTMAEKGEVDFLALYDDSLFIGFMVVCTYEHMNYLFFLAIASEFRSCGYGGQALALLETLYPGKQQVVDLEKLDDRAENQTQRVSRRAFYLRSGYKETGKFISYLGVDYEILCKDTDFDLEAFKKMMTTFSIKGFNPHYSGSTT